MCWHGHGKWTHPDIIHTGWLHGKTRPQQTQAWKTPVESCWHVCGYKITATCSQLMPILYTLSTFQAAANLAILVQKCLQTCSWGLVNEGNSDAALPLSQSPSKLAMNGLHERGLVMAVWWQNMANWNEHRFAVPIRDALVEHSYYSRSVGLNWGVTLGRL